MLHKIILLISLSMVFVPYLSASNDFIQEADKAYMDDDFENALELYLQAAQEDGNSSNLYYNIGNCYYRLNMPGKAILNYERALKLDPSNKDAATNLSFVNSRIIDKPVDNLSLSEKIGQRVVKTLSADTWAWLTFSLFALFICAAAGYIFLSDVMIRKTCFFSGLFFIICTIIGVVITISSAGRMTKHNEAIIISESVNLGTSPRVPKDKSEEAFLLHEGTRLEIVDSLTTTNSDVRTKWYEVMVDHEHRAWINSNDVEKI